MFFLFFQKISWTIMAFLNRFVFRVEVIGKENVKDLNPPLVIVANHKSYWDHFFLGKAINLELNSPFFPMRFIAADYLFKTHLGIFIFILGGFRTYYGQGLEVSLKKPLTILKNKGTVIFYPEGGIIKEADKIGEPKRGVGALALWSEAKILPVAIKGSRDKKDGVKIILGKPFFVKDHFEPSMPEGAEEDFAQASRIIMDKVKELFFSA